MTPDVSDKAHAAILLRVAAKTVHEARSTWQLIREGDTGSLRAAFRACVLAVKSVKRAAAAWTHDARESRRLAAEEKRLVAAATDLKDRLVRAQEAPKTAAAAKPPPPR